MTKQRLVRLDALKLCLWLVKKKQFDQLQVSKWHVSDDAQS